MTTQFIIGVCLIALVWGLIRGGGGRLMLVAGVVVGWSVGLAQQMASTGTDLATTISSVVASLGGSL